MVAPPGWTTLLIVWSWWFKICYWKVERNYVDVGKVSGSHRCC